MRLEGFQNGVFIVLDMLRANNTAATTNRATSTRGVEALRRLALTKLAAKLQPLKEKNKVTGS